jgi:beta-N-acetylhexosaminidase
MPDASLVAPHIVTGLPVGGVDPAFERVVGEIPFAGFLLFRRDFATPAELSGRVTTLGQLSANPNPLLCVDEEGGLVTQLSPEIEAAPSARVLGRAADAGQVRAITRSLGQVLRSYGLTIDFAPVCDVDLEPTNPVIGPRSFSRDPEVVSELADAFASGLESGGVLPCAKHFPGHGDTLLDSHLSLPVCRATRAELNDLHLPPFRRAIARGVPLIMVSHVAYLDLDCGGVVVTDAMEMKAVSALFPPGEAAVRALEAGADLLCYGSYDEGVAEALAALTAAVRTGRLSAERLSASRQRIEALQQRLGPGDRRRDSPATAAGVDLEALCRRAIRWVGGEQKPAETVGRRARWRVFEPDWGAGPTLAELLRSRGLEVFGGTWKEGPETGLGEAEADAVLMASRHRGAPSAEEILWLSRWTGERPTWIVAFAQDNFLHEVGGAAGRLSACDPGPTMRRAVASALFADA